MKSLCLEHLWGIVDLNLTPNFKIKILFNMFNYS